MELDLHPFYLSFSKMEDLLSFLPTPTFTLHNSDVFILLPNGVAYAPPRLSPILVGQPVSAIFISKYYNSVITVDGSVYMVLGSGHYPIHLPLPALKIAYNNDNLFVLLVDGTVWTVDIRGHTGQRNVNVPRLFPLPLPVTDFISTDSSRLFVLSDGSVLGVGENIYYELGTQTRSPSPLTRMPLPHNSQAVSVALSTNFSLVLLADGTAWGSGLNTFDQLGTGDRSMSIVFTPTKLKLDKRIVSIACGARSTVCLTDEGEVYVFGSNKEGQLGIGSDIRGRSARMPLPGLARTVLSSGTTTLVILDDGSPYICGDISSDSRSQVRSNTPVPLGNLPVEVMKYLPV